MKRLLILAAAPLALAACSPAAEPAADSPPAPDQAAAVVVTAATAFAATASAETELVVVSWGGAYSASQQKAYHDPYMKANPGIKIVNDDSAPEVLGPAPAPIPRLRGKYRFQLLLKTVDPQTHMDAGRVIAENATRVPRSVQVSLDVNPVNML